ncbi:profilin [Gigaspora rosea]|uniref:Profilin n=1 Tax=Gigaspora rosea TaxID=44941 RepID=A0A397W501_9GLOM|nr:profilin [Gigaspora rosea]
MSWQTYIDSNLVGTGKISQAAIYGHDGTLWASSANFNPATEEIKNIILSFDDATKIQENGIRCNGTKYYALSHDDKTIHGKNAKKGTEGVIAQKTNQAIILGTYCEGTMPGEANIVIGELADYLRSVNY